MSLSFGVAAQPVHEPPRILINAVHGWGKTSFAGGAPNPIIIDLEGGANTTDIPRTPQVKSFDVLMDILRELYEKKGNGHDFETLIIDSTTRLDDLINKKVCEDAKVETLDKIGFGGGSILAMDLWQRLWFALENIRVDKGMTIINIAHPGMYTVDEPEGDSYSRIGIQMKRSAKASTDVAGFLETSHDVVIYGDFAVYKNEEVDGFSKKTVAKGGKSRTLQTTNSAGITAKSRYSGMGMPTMINVPTFDGLIGENERKNMFWSFAQFIPYFQMQKQQKQQEQHS